MKKKEEKENINIKRENKIVPKIKKYFFYNKTQQLGKIRKKYERPEFKNNRILLNSAMTNNKNLIAITSTYNAMNPNLYLIFD